MMRLHVRQRYLHELFGRALRENDVHQLPCYVAAQAAQHVLEQLESLALILVKRIALRVAA